MEISELSKYRTEIDALDEEILRLLNLRAGNVLAIGRIKKQSGRAVLDSEREAGVLKRLESLNEGPLDAEDISRIWRVFFAVSRDLEHKVNK